MVAVRCSLPSSQCSFCVVLWLGARQRFAWANLIHVWTVGTVCTMSVDLFADIGLWPLWIWVLDLSAQCHQLRRRYET